MQLHLDAFPGNEWQVGDQCEQEQQGRGDRHDEIVRYGGSPFREPVRFDLFIKEANYIIQRNALEPW